MWFQLEHKVHDNIYLVIYFTTYRRMDLLNNCWQNSLLLMKCPVIFYLPSRLRKEPEEKGKDTQTGCWGRWIQGSQMSEGWQQNVKVGTCKKYMYKKVIWLNKWNDFKGHNHTNTVGHLQCLCLESWIQPQQQTKWRRWKICIFASRIQNICCKIGH